MAKGARMAKLTARLVVLAIALLCGPSGAFTPLSSRTRLLASVKRSAPVAASSRSLVPSMVRACANPQRDCCGTVRAVCSFLLSFAKHRTAANASFCFDVCSRSSLSIQQAVPRHEAEAFELIGQSAGEVATKLSKLPGRLTNIMSKSADCNRHLSW